MDARFRRHWDRWHDLTRRGQTPADFLASASDETLVELLAVGDQGTPVERNIIATELTNRISRFHRTVSDHGVTTDALIDANKESLARAGRADDEIRAENKKLRGASAKTSRYKGEGEREGGW